MYNVIYTIIVFNSDGTIFTGTDGKMRISTGVEKSFDSLDSAQEFVKDKYDDIVATMAGEREKPRFWTETEIVEKLDANTYQFVERNSLYGGYYQLCKWIVEIQ